VFERKGKRRYLPKPHVNSYQHSIRITEQLGIKRRLHMNDIYSPPASNLNVEIATSVAIRPLAVTVIAYIFIVLGAIDLVFTLKNGIIYAISKFSEDGNLVSKGFRLELLWLALYGIGAGLMRRGRFARVMACVVGIAALIIPGVVFIYILYFSNSKEYFSKKTCAKCSEEKWLNIGYLYKNQSCKKCKNQVEVENN